GNRAGGAIDHTLGRHECHRAPAPGKSGGIPPGRNRFSPFRRVASRKVYRGRSTALIGALGFGASCAPGTPMPTDQSESRPDDAARPPGRWRRVSSWFVVVVPLLVLVASGCGSSGHRAAV